MKLGIFMSSNEHKLREREEFIRQAVAHSLVSLNLVDSFICLLTAMPTVLREPPHSRWS